MSKKSSPGANSSPAVVPVDVDGCSGGGGGSASPSLALRMRALVEAVATGAGLSFCWPVVGPLRDETAGAVVVVCCRLTLMAVVVCEGGVGGSKPGDARGVVGRIRPGNSVR